MLDRRWRDVGELLENSADVSSSQLRLRASLRMETDDPLITATLRDELGLGWGF